MQQGRVEIDADGNEQIAIDSYRAATTATDVIGQAGYPMGALPNGEPGGRLRARAERGGHRSHDLAGPHVRGRPAGRERHSGRHAARPAGHARGDDPGRFRRHPARHLRGLPRRLGTAHHRAGQPGDPGERAGRPGHLGAHQAGLAAEAGLPRGGSRLRGAPAQLRERGGAVAGGGGQHRHAGRRVGAPRRETCPAACRPRPGTSGWRTSSTGWRSTSQDRTARLPSNGPGRTARWSP